MSETQSTLTGEETDGGRVRPATFVFCWECESWLLRSERSDHPHEIYDDDVDSPEPSRTGPPDDVPPDERDRQAVLTEVTG